MLQRGERRALREHPAAEEPLHRRALAIGERSYGPHHPLVAAYLNNLAMLYLSMGNHAGAEPLCRQATEIRRVARVASLGGGILS